MSLTSFLATTVVISTSGALSPGPVTAVTIGHGSVDRHAGARVAIGHALVEVPFVVVLTVGFGEVLGSLWLRSAIGLAGGACLLWMGLSLLGAARRAGLDRGGAARGRGPIASGLLLTATNPYFYLWWLSVGMTLVLEAVSLGPAAFVLFVAVHWSCDLAWLWLISTLSFKGGHWFGEKFRAGAFVVCGLALTAFGVKFVLDATTALVG